MAHKKNTTNLTELLLQCVTQPDPMLNMLEWLCTHLMEAEVDQQLGAEKSQAHGRQERIPQPNFIFQEPFLRTLLDAATSSPTPRPW